HERWDGKGYPNGLAGEAIPLEARIVAVADAFDAMCRDRVHKRAMTLPEAIAEMTRGAGTQFDPVVVEAFLRAVDAGEVVYQEPARCCGPVEGPARVRSGLLDHGRPPPLQFWRARPRDALPVAAGRAGPRGGPPRHPDPTEGVRGGLRPRGPRRPVRPRQVVPAPGPGPPRRRRDRDGLPAAPGGGGAGHRGAALRPGRVGAPVREARPRPGGRGLRRAARLEPSPH